MALRAVCLFVSLFLAVVQCEETILYKLDKIAAQLRVHSDETDKQLETLKQDIGVLKEDNEILKQDNEILKDDNELQKTVLDNILVELSNIGGLLNSTLDRDQQFATSCYRGMPHKSSREKFVLQGRFLALCDTETDGGGWVIIQRRARGDVDFYRGWDDYKKGFGTPDTDFWIGNDIISVLTSEGYNQLRIDIVHNNTMYFAEYTNFSQAAERFEYTITVDGYSGNVVDRMTYHNGSKFSTFDRDNDMNAGSCAVIVHGGWWYRDCYRANLNGAWGRTDNTGINWRFTDSVVLTNLTLTEMKVRYTKR